MLLPYGILSSLGGLEPISTLIMAARNKRGGEKLWVVVVFGVALLVWRLRQKFDCLTRTYNIVSNDSSLFWGTMKVLSGCISLNVDHQGIARSEIYAKSLEYSRSREHSFNSRGVVFDDHFGRRFVVSGSLILYIHHRFVQASPYQNRHELLVRNLNPFVSSDQFHGFFLQAERQYRLSAGETLSTVMQLDVQGGWEYTMVRRRLATSIFFPDRFEEDILEDAKTFLASKADYEKQGLGHCHRRGYLFHGVPGTGKSTCAKAIAAELQLRLYMINLSQEGIFDSDLLRRAAGNIKAPAVVLFEDIDCAGLSRRIEGESTDVKNHLGCVLSALDGLVEESGYIIIMTTNHPEKLDSALIRAGRIDLCFKFGEGSKTQIGQLFDIIYPDEAKKGGLVNARGQFLDLAMKLNYTVAQCESILIRHMKDPHKAVAELEREV